MMLVNAYAPLLFRICLVVLFPFSAVDKIRNWDAAMQQASGLPFKPQMLVLSIVVEIVTPICIITGWHDRLAAFGQLVEPAPGLYQVLGMQGDVEAVLGLGDIGRPRGIHVGAHQRLIADLEPAMHQPGLVLLVGDGHARRRVAVRDGRGDPALQDFGIELECLAALPLETQAGYDLHDRLPIGVDLRIIVLPSA